MEHRCAVVIFSLVALLIATSFYFFIALDAGLIWKIICLLGLQLGDASRKVNAPVFLAVGRLAKSVALRILAKSVKFEILVVGRKAI